MPLPMRVDTSPSRENLPPIYAVMFHVVDLHDLRDRHDFKLVGLYVSRERANRMAKQQILERFRRRRRDSAVDFFRRYRVKIRNGCVKARALLPSGALAEVWVEEQQVDAGESSGSGLEGDSVTVEELFTFSDIEESDLEYCSCEDEDSDEDECDYELESRSFDDSDDQPISEDEELE